MNGIVTKTLTKDYGHHRGIFDLDLEVHEGEALGYIGPNGAGKTTTLRLLMNLIRPTHGSAEILGMDSVAQSVGIRKVTGYMPAESPEYPNHTGAKILDLLAHLRGGIPAASITELAKQFDLDLSRKYREYSHGNKQKIWLIQAIMHDPKLLILDEPTSGLDPIMQQSFRELVVEAKNRGSTIILSSHVLSEVQEICDRIGVVHNGKLRQVGTMQELRIGNKHKIDATVAGEIDATAVEHLQGISHVAVTGHRVQCVCDGEMSGLIQYLQGVRIVSLESTGMSLEEVFLAEYGQPADA